MSPRTALALTAVGVACALAGIALIYPPAAFIVAGAALVGFALFTVDVRKNQ